MLETTRYEGRRRVRGTLALALLLGAFAALVISIYPSIAESSVEIEALIESLPEAFRAGFGVESYTTIEGFLSGEFYQFVWVLLFGLYATYTAAGAVAPDVESGRIYLVLATPVSRVRVAAEKYLALFVPVVALNLLVPLFVFGTTIAVGYPVDFPDLVAVHLMSVPYLLTCGSIGMVLSVVLSRGDAAQRGGIAVVFLLFVLDSVTTGTDFEWLGTLSPTRYYDPTEILVDGKLDLKGALVLLGGTVCLLLVSLAVFERRDV
ncbi:MAG: ABC transporter permease subunit [Haloplanus sp.]